MTTRTYILLWATFGLVFGVLFCGGLIFAARIWLINPILRALQEGAS